MATAWRLEAQSLRTLTGRQDYLAAMHNDWVYCLAAERLLGGWLYETYAWIRRRILQRDSPARQPRRIIPVWAPAVLAHSARGHVFGGTA